VKIIFPASQHAYNKTNHYDRAFVFFIIEPMHIQVISKKKQKKQDFSWVNAMGYQYLKIMIE